MRGAPRRVPSTTKHLQLLGTFANQAAIAIQNVRLFNETKEALEQQTASAEVLTVIGNSVSDAAPVFERIIDSARHLLRSQLRGHGPLGQDGLVHQTMNPSPHFPDDPLYPKIAKYLRSFFPAPTTPDAAQLQRAQAPCSALPQRPARSRRATSASRAADGWVTTHSCMCR